MFAGIRKALKTPLARPPGRRGLLRRFAPEWCALAVYAAFFLQLLTGALHGPRVIDSALLDCIRVAAAAGYGLAGVCIVLGSAVTGALAWAGERERGAMDSLLLTSTDHRMLARGRFLHALAPWLRFLAWLIPLYVCMGISGFFALLLDLQDYYRLAPLAGACQTWLVSVRLNVHEGLHDFISPPMWHVLLGLLRLVNDLTVAVFACAAGFHIATRVRSAGRALLLSCLLIPFVLFTVFSAHDWVEILTYFCGSAYHPWSVAKWYSLLGATMFAVRCCLAWVLVRSAARNFDAYVLGEASERS